MTTKGLTRRQFVERALGLGLTTSAVGGLLAACGGEPAPTASPLPPLGTTLPEELTVLTWAGYISADIRRGFEQKYGVRVVTEGEGSLGDGMVDILRAAPGWDVITASDCAVPILAEGRRAVGGSSDLQPIHTEYVPGVADMLPFLSAQTISSGAGGATYGVPVQWGAMGLAVRTDKVSEPITRWAQVFPPEGRRYKGKIQMLNDERETPGAALRMLGYSLNTTREDELDEAAASLMAQKPLVLGYDSFRIERAIVEGLPLVHCWNSDCVKPQRALGPDRVSFVLLEEGFALWADCLCVPRNAPSPYAAHLFIDYLLEPEVNAGMSNRTGSSSPIAGAEPYIEADVLALTPTEEEVRRGEFIEDLGRFSRAYTDAWAKVKSS